MKELNKCPISLFNNITNCNWRNPNQIWILNSQKYFDFNKITKNIDCGSKWNLLMISRNITFNAPKDILHAIAVDGPLGAYQLMNVTTKQNEKEYLPKDNYIGIKIIDDKIILVCLNIHNYNFMWKLK
jgi:hypothetical protein